MDACYLRPASRGDIPAIVALERRCFTEPWPPIAFAQFVHATGFLLAIDPTGVSRPGASPADGRLAGYVVTSPAMGEGEQVAHIRNLAVDPDYRRRGIATRLIEASIARYPPGRFDRVRLEVRASNEPAIALYRRQGFTVTGRIPGYYADGEAAIVMEWSLENDTST